MIRAFKIGGQIRNPLFEIVLLNWNSVKISSKNKLENREKVLTIAIYDIA